MVAGYVKKYKEDAMKELRASNNSSNGQFRPLGEASSHLSFANLDVTQKA